MSIKLLKIALIFFFISYNNSYSQDKEYHIVEKGETFYSISKKFNKSIEELKRLNNLKGNTLSIGQKIIINIFEIEEEKITNSNNEIRTNRVEGFASSIDDSEISPIENFFSDVERFSNAILGYLFSFSSEGPSIRNDYPYL